MTNWIDEEWAKIAEERWREKTNTGENRAIDPKHRVHEQLACNQDDRPVLLDKVKASGWFEKLVAVCALLAMFGLIAFLAL